MFFQVFYYFFDILNFRFINNKNCILSTDNYKILNSDSSHELFFSIDIAIFSIVNKHITFESIVLLIFIVHIP